MCQVHRLVRILQRFFSQKRVYPSIEYIAGFLDGEGSFIISKMRRRSKLGFTLHARVLMCNTSKETLEAIYKTLQKIGVKSSIIYQRDKRKEARSWKKLYYIAISRQEDMLRFAKLVLPFSITKKEQIKTMIEFLESRLSNGKKWQPFTQREIELTEKMTHLNQKGRVYQNL